MKSPDFHIPSPDVGPAEPTERVRSGIGAAARALAEKIKSVFSIPDGADVVTGYRESGSANLAPRTEADINAFSSGTDQFGVVHDSTSGQLLQLTDEMIARGDAARANGESVTDAINETNE